jgi:gliding motility associated protien GldN
MKKIITLTFVLGFLSNISFGQNVFNAKTPEEVNKAKEVHNSKGERVKEVPKPLTYAYVDERDVMWSNFVWEIIDLDEKVNLPLYFPIKDVGPHRKSLFEILIDGVKNSEINNYYSDEYFTQKLSKEELLERLSIVDTLAAGRNQARAFQPVSPEFIDTVKIKPIHITQYKVYGIWYFDKRRSEFMYRPLGIAPVGPDLETLKAPPADGEIVTQKPSDELVTYFWLWYPELRDVLVRNKVFNEKNTAFSLNFDYIFNHRMFHSHIYKEDNVYSDQPVNDYVKENSLFQLQESQRLKERMREYEHELWEY